MFISTKLKIKGQVFSTDIIIGVIIFTAAILIYYKAMINFSEDDNELFDNIIMDAKSISDSLMSEGNPANWSKENINTLGLHTNQRVNETKLRYFAEIPYKDTKSLLGTKYDYYIIFKDRNNNVYPINESLEGIGKPGVNLANVNRLQNQDTLVKIVRITIRNSDIQNMVIFLWD